MGHSYKGSRCVPKAPTAPPPAPVVLSAITGQDLVWGNGPYVPFAWGTYDPSNVSPGAEYELTTPPISDIITNAPVSNSVCLAAVDSMGNIVPGTQSNTVVVI
jgi:hypothetical protein